MLSLRLIVPSDRAEAVIATLGEHGAVTNIVCLPGAARRPEGDVVLCDVAREDASVVLRSLGKFHLDECGSIAVEQIDLSISAGADAAEATAVGSPGDAVVWEAIEAQTASSAELTSGFILLMILATSIAAVGILTDSVVLIIGAMVVGPEFGPLAGVCVGLVQRRLDLARRSLFALAVGFPLGIAVTYAGVLGLMAAGVTRDELVHDATLFISHPDVYSVVIALLAGVAGMLSLTTARAGPLIGVFISVTTIPAAANIAVAAAYGSVDELGGSATQLAVNVCCIVAAGALTLAAQRLAFVRRVARVLREQSRKRRRAAQAR